MTIRTVWVCCMSLEGHSDSGPARQRYEALSETADLVVQAPALPELFQKMAENLQKVVCLNFLNLSLHDPTFDTLRLHLWQGGGTPAIPVEEAGEDTASGWVWH